MLVGTKGKKHKQHPLAVLILQPTRSRKKGDFNNNKHSTPQPGSNNTTRFATAKPHNLCRRNGVFRIAVVS